MWTAASPANRKHPASDLERSEYYLHHRWGGDLRDPVQDREQGKVSLEGGIHLGAVEHGLGIFPVGHLLVREGGTEDILG